MGNQGKGLGLRNSRTLTIRMTREQRAKLEEIGRVEGKSVGEVVRAMMLVAELALTDPKGFAESFAAVAVETVQRDIGLPDVQAVKVETRVMAGRLQAVERNARGELPLVMT